ncbi:DMT family transporter [Nitratireductor sp. XY-223]|uniref:DMT family transporter n=1 Tax=Nitratireductor sp. XY-223 TaxID=2561926 RepID=UPI00197FF2A5|nr:DMT family transporter [Nitratireductor sp. XY-223]
MDTRTPATTKAVALMVGASLLVAATSLIAKRLGIESGAGAGLNPFQVSAGRFVFALLALGAFLSAAPASRPSLKGARWSWHLMRSLCGWLGVTCMFAAVARMPVAEATAISFLNPLVTMGLAVLILGERITVRKYVAAGLAIAGALLILRPGTDAFQMAGILALAAALFMGFEAIFIKRLSDTEPALRVLLINNSLGACVSVIAASFVWSVPSAEQWVLLVALGVVMVCAQSLFIQSMKRGEASVVMPAFYTVLVFAAFYDFVLYGVLPSYAAVIGAALIVAGALALAVRRSRG